jgi:LIVCS family branched-chain amino acid:cation transporter
MEATITKRSSTLTTGFAIFSMLFGAGNIVFALAIGQYAQDKNFFAIAGLLITAVGVPLLGLIAMALFNGDYKSFFDRLGRIPGFMLLTMIMGLIGPFGATPRCIALSYSTAKMYLPDIPLFAFSAAACLFAFLCSYRRTSILKIVGYFLTPLKLGSLAFIIVMGLMFSPVTPSASHSELAVFFRGLKDGYQTMDLLATFFFCSVVLDCLRRSMNVSHPVNFKGMIGTTLKASCIGAGLLALIYIGFSYVAAAYSHTLTEVRPDELISQIAVQVLGPYAGLVVSFTVTLACLTTAIALTTVFAEFLRKDILNDKVSYGTAVFITLMITFAFSLLNFTGIIRFLAPILEICYPALITLSLVNILYKLYQFKPVKAPVWIVFAASLGAYFLL